MSNTSTLDENLRVLETLRRTIEASGSLSEETLRKIEYKFRLECNYHSNGECLFTQIDKQMYPTL